MNRQFCHLPRLTGNVRQDGFTLVELIMVIVLMGILAASFMMFFKPTIDGYFDARRRADLSDIADTALRRMMQDVKSAVPNSINLISNQCFQLVPSIGGGRYRTDLDGVNDVNPPCVPSATCSAFPDAAAAASATTTFDALVLQGTVPVQNDFVVINNQNRDDVYGATPVSRFTVTASPTTPRITDGTQRIVIGGNPAASGYAQGRFQVVSQNVPSMMYSCSGGRLYRKILTTSKESACAANGDVLATDVASCSFVYTSNPSATQASGFVTLNLTLSRNNEPVTLSYGVHVDNQP